MSTPKSAPTVLPVQGMPSKSSAQETSAGTFDWRAGLKKTPRDDRPKSPNLPHEESMPLVSPRALLSPRADLVFVANKPASS